ncbi:substrate-binding periplasmic protein [Alkalimarinus coralli]|uniref:substrate-binding periplasmic protein n=1 Tax=Alkalimarinus coralli TaxID=2935863 RepID=UPI00202B05FD|nr:ABC transporter substrate-binding protein [Alkalimarinus coralli]
MKVLFALLVISCLFPNHSIAERLTFVAENYTHFEFEENGKIQGFTVDILKAILAKTKHTGSFNIHPWARAERESLRAANTVIHTLTRSEEREDNYHWLGPIAPRKVFFYKARRRNDISIKTLNDAKAFKTAVIRGQAITKFLLKNGFKADKHLIIVNGDKQRFDLLRYGRIDLIVFVEPVLNWRMAKLNDPNLKLEKAFLIDDSKSYYVGFNKETSPKIVADFRSVYEEMKHDGSIAQLQCKYMKQCEVTPSTNKGIGDE